MIEVGLYTRDYTLQRLLSSALGKEFQILLKTDENGIDQFLASESCNILILDMISKQDSLPERIELAKSLIASQVSVVIMADDALRSTANELVRLGAFGYCRRPPSIRDLKIMLRQADETFSQKQQPEIIEKPVESVDDVGRMIGTSPQMQQIHHLIRCVTNNNASVLVTGESGTGKELVVRAIHNQGVRAKQPFVAVSCGAIPETLIEAELFGYEKGAFTGSVGSREGYLERSGDGTLFLDEIGELSLFTQVKLLRVLQEREFSRLGSSKLIPLQSRLVLATHRNLSEMVTLGKFREDLYYRINVIRIQTPTLQEHAEDIPQIANYFLRRYSQIYQKPVRSIDPNALSMIQNYHWPGNVRELENVIQRAIILAEGDTLRIVDLPQRMKPSVVASIDEYCPTGSFERQIRDHKFRLASAAVRENNGNKTLAARSLCISRAYLHRLLLLGEPDELDMEEERMELESG